LYHFPSVGVPVPFDLDMLYGAYDKEAVSTSLDR